MMKKMFSSMACNEWMIKGCFMCAVIGLWPSLAEEVMYDTASITDSSVLRNHIIDANDHRFRPIINQSSVIVVNVEFHFLQLLHVDELEMKMKTSCAFHFSWNDEIRIWLPRNYSGISVLHPDPTDVWRPRIFISNSLTTHDVFKDDYAHLSVLWNGKTRWQPGIILVTTCDLDLRLYPYDEQVCSIFARSSLFAREMVFNKSRDTAIIDEYTQSGEWTLEKTEIETYRVGQDLEKFSLLEIKIYLRRHPGFFFLNSLFPTMLLSFLSIMVFVLPRSSGERAGYSMTVLLTLSLIQTTVSSELPKTPQTFPYIVMYIFALLILSWGMMICTVCILAWEHRQESKANNENLCDSCNLRQIAQMEENFVAVHPGSFGDDDATDKEHLKGYYGPLEADDSSAQSGTGLTRRKFVFLRDFRRVHPEHPDNEKQTKETSQGISFFQLNWLPVSDIDVMLFWIFLAMWLIVSLVFLLLMLFG